MAAQKQQAVQVVRQSDDPAASVDIAQVDVPVPGDGEVLVRMLLRPINPADIRSIKGQFSGFRPQSLPATPGIEGVGEVALKCEKFEVGQRVVSTAWPLLSGRGTWQEYCVAPVDKLYAVPDTLSNQLAAIMWSNPVTAMGLLRTAGVPQGEWLLQNAANSSIGRQIIQMASDAGVKTINVVRSSSQRDELLKLGADVVIALDTEKVGPAVSAATKGQGAFCGLDAVGGAQTGEMLSSLREGGMLLLYSGLSGSEFSGGMADIVFGRRSIQGFRLTPWFNAHDAARQEAIIKEVFRLLEHVITPTFGPSFPLEHVKDALAAAQSPSHSGAKLFLTS